MNSRCSRTGFIRKNLACRTVLAGILLGVASAFLVIVLGYCAGSVVLLFIGSPPSPIAGGVRITLDSIAVVVLAALLPFVFTVVPAGIAGGVNGMTQYLLWCRRGIRSRLSLLIGGIVGAGAAYAAFSLVQLWVPEQYSGGTLAAAVLSTLGLLAGLMHSWILRRWFETRYDDAQKRRIC